MTYLPRDFIETREGLVFAVMDSRPEDGRVLGFLRYIPGSDGPRKLGTDEANAHLREYAPRYLFNSRRLDARLHGVPIADIRRHYRPRERVRELLASKVFDAVEGKALRLLAKFAAEGLDLDRVGLTGSLLIGAQKPGSDIDVVIYGREFFFAARKIVGRLLATGALAALDEAAWRDAYHRRGCALSCEEYVRHERRKLNKALSEGVKFDITLIDDLPELDLSPARKLGPRIVRAEVTDALHAFDQPAVYRLNHPEIPEAWSFIQTYAGQAEAGETVEIAGLLEETEAGRRRIVVGSSREAPGEYIRLAPGWGSSDLAAFVAHPPMRGSTARPAK
jgi:predicted nucleotidyltransferase